MLNRKPFARQQDHVAVVAHGAHPVNRVEIVAKVKDVEESYNITQGSIVSIDEAGEYVIGCGKGTGVNFPVPCIAFKNVADPDVSTGYMGKTHRLTTISAVGGKIVALPCTAGYEIETTEFDPDADYFYNDAVIPATAEGKVGLLTKATAQPFQAGGASEPIIGFVSRRPYDVKAHANRRIGFLTNFIPAAH